ncbi:MAG: acyl-CoA dehydrogenase family protein [Acidobacteriota bacterium]
MPDLSLIRRFLDASHRELADEVAATAGAVAALPHAATDDAARRQSRELLGMLGDARLARFAVEGTEPDLRALCLIRETLAAASVLADSVFALQGLGSMPIVLAGSDALRARILPEVVAGRLMAAFAMTEPGAGSDVASMTTRATRDGDGWVLDGHKHLITNAGVADFYCVFAKTTPDAGARGITLFFVEADNPGLRFVRPQILSEPHPLGELAFEACRVPDAHRLGPVDGGFRVGMRTLDRLRPTVAAAACGMAERALAEALDHATTRRQFDAPLAELPAIQAGLATMATDLAASRLLVYRAAFEADDGAERTTLEAAMAKSFATEAAQRVVDRAVQILGGRGCLAAHPVDRLYRAVRALRIYEGATEVQHLVIARQILRNHAQEPTS